MQSIFKKYILILIGLYILTINISANEFGGLSESAKAVPENTIEEIKTDNEINNYDDTYYYEDKYKIIDDSKIKEDFNIHYDYTPETNEEKLDAKKLELLYELRIKLIEILNTKKDSALKNIKDQKTKDIYSNKLDVIISNIESNYSYNNYWYDGAGKYFVKDLKENITSFKAIIKELKYIQNTGKSPYNIDIKNKLNIESNIIDLQKDIINIIIPEIQKYLDNDIKEDGNFEFTFKNKEFGKVELIVEKYYSITKILKLQQEVGLKGALNLDITTPGKYEYNEATQNWEKSEGDKIKGDISFDINLVADNDTYYITVNKLDINLDGINLETLNLAQQTLDIIKGKTLKIDLQNYNNNSTIEGPKVIKNFITIIADTLKNNSLFTTYKEIDKNTYELAPKYETIAKIAKLFGEEITEEDFDRNIEHKYNSNYHKPVLYTNTDKGFKIYTIVDEIDAEGEIALYYTTGNPIFLMNVIEPNGSNKAYLKITKSSVFIDIFILNDFAIKGQWLNKYLDLDITTESGSINASGKLNEDITDIIIKANAPLLGLNNIQIASFSIEKINNKYEFNIDINLEDTPLAFIFNHKGKVSQQFGEYNIDIPNYNIITPEEIKNELKTLGL